MNEQRRLANSTTPSRLPSLPNHTQCAQEHEGQETLSSIFAIQGECRSFFTPPVEDTRSHSTHVARSLLVSHPQPSPPPSAMNSNSRRPPPRRKGRTTPGFRDSTSSSSWQSSVLLLGFSCCCLGTSRWREEEGRPRDQGLPCMKRHVSATRPLHNSNALAD